MVILVTAKVVKKNDKYLSFECSGHAGYARRGKDIICSAISMLSYNCANSIMALTQSEIEVCENDGFISWEFKNDIDDKASLLMDSLLIGLRSIMEDYDNKYLTLIIEEV